MENSENEGEAGEGEGQSEDSAELIKGYLTFGKGAVVGHRKLAVLLFASGVGLTVLANAYVPRTYACSTSLMAIGNPVLETSTAYVNPLAGAQGYILRTETLTNMVHDLDLLAKVEQRRPTILKLKNSLSNALSGPVSEKLKVTMLVGTLQTKIFVMGEGPVLTVEADWNDAATAAEIAGSAQESFLKARHTAEVSAFEEKVAILEEHAGKLREEIDQLAGQINNQTERALAQPPPATTTATTTPASPAIRVVNRNRAAPKPATDADLPALKEKLDTDKKKLAELQAEQDRRVRDEQAKLADLKLRLTPAHPQVVTQEERVAMVLQTPSELLHLSAEVAELTSQLKLKEGLGARIAADIGGGAGGAAVVPAQGMLPQAVVQALQTSDSDPALAEQLKGAVSRYGALSDSISEGRIGLDTAQAAFKHRYEVIVPVEQPSKPKSPKPAVIWGAGILLSALLALLVPVLTELRKGMLSARWQVQQLQLPILAELRLPPSSSE